MVEDQHLELWLKFLVGTNHSYLRCWVITEKYEYYPKTGSKQANLARYNLQAHKTEFKRLFSIGMDSQLHVVRCSLVVANNFFDHHKIPNALFTCTQAI